ncbi:MAG: catalase family peroxidase [Actinomycetota bacterium]|nr:catalase family peroxidase [Actinomycetota bacterium]
MGDFAEEIVDAMNAIHGAHPGFRAVHAKGSCCRGTFVATADAARLCVAPHLQGQEISVTVRFSSGSGKPTRADGARDERGMAVKFHLPDGSSTDVVSLTLPVFFVKTPQDFLAFLETQRPDPETGKPDLDRVGDFINAHPETQIATMFVMTNESPASFAGCSFNGIHAFRLTAPDGAQRFVRYRWVPDAAPATLTDAETRALGRNYLHEGLEKRLSSQTIGYELRFQVAEGDDDPNDPTTLWPEERELVTAGRLTLTDFIAQECEGMIFDPGRLTDGIERSDDPILHARSDAYSVSFDRRTKATEP